MDGCVGDVPETGNEDARRGHKEKHVEADDPVDHDRGQGLGPIARLLPREHPCLEQVAARDTRGGQVEKVAQKPNPHGGRHEKSIPKARTRYHHRTMVIMTAVSNEGKASGQPAPSLGPVRASPQTRAQPSA